MKRGRNFGLRIADCGLGLCMAIWFALIACSASWPSIFAWRRLRSMSRRRLGRRCVMGLVPPATGVNDPLSARGIVLQADKQPPVVLVAFDWVGIGNEGHDAFRKAIAEACKTPIDRVCVHALHQHDAPGCDFLAETIAAEAGLPNELFPVEYSREAIAACCCSGG